MESLFKFKCYEIVYAELSKKVTFSRNTCLRKGSSSEEVAVQNKHCLEKSAYSE